MKLTLYKQMFLVKYSKQLQKILSNSLKNTGVNNSEIVSTTIPAKLINVLFFLKNSTYSQFTLLTDIVAYDRPGCSERFTLIYYLLRVNYNTRLFLTLSVGDRKTGIVLDCTSRGSRFKVSWGALMLTSLSLLTFFSLVIRTFILFSSIWSPLNLWFLF